MLLGWMARAARQNAWEHQLRIYPPLSNVYNLGMNAGFSEDMPARVTSTLFKRREISALQTSPRFEPLASYRFRAQHSPPGATKLDRI